MMQISIFRTIKFCNFFNRIGGRILSALNQINILKTLIDASDRNTFL